MADHRALLNSALLLGLAVAQSACVGFGHGIGRLIDQANAQSFAPTALADDGIDPGAKVKVELEGGGELRGAFLGIEPLPADEYAERYDRSRERLTPRLALPALGEVCALTLTGDRRLEGELVGFDYDGTVVVRRVEPVRLAAAEVRELSAGDLVVRGAALEAMIAQRELPALSAVALDAAGGATGRRGRRLVPLDDVRAVRRQPKTGRVIGALVGLAVDVVAIAYFGSKIDFMEF